MKKIYVFALFASLCFASALHAAALRVGASPAPHAEILEAAADDLKALGIDLEIIEFTDYVKPNMSLSDGEIDANYFQHLPYLKSFCKDRGLKLVSVGSIHVEPMGFFSKRISKIQDLKDGALIALPGDPTNCGRALLLLQSAGLIGLSPEAGLEATELDVTDNPKKLRFRSLEAAQLPRVLDDVDGAVINGNYAIPAGLNPAKDALLVEGAQSPYANVIAVREGDEKRPEITALLQVLQSPKVDAFIRGRYEGGVVPAFSSAVSK